MPACDRRACGCLWWSPGVQGADYPIGEGKLSITGSTYLGTALRTDDQDPKLLADANSALVGIAGQCGDAGAGRNGDDGNLNFDRGDRSRQCSRATCRCRTQWRDYGIEASGQAWYDYATADMSHPWGNVQNGYAAGQPLSDDGALARSRFSGVALDDLYGHGHHQLDELSVDWKLGLAVARLGQAD